MRYSPSVLADGTKRMHEIGMLIMGCTKDSVTGFHNVNNIIYDTTTEIPNRSRLNIS
jgi:hypothetical protein